MKTFFRVLGICLIAVVSMFTLVGCGESAYQLAVRNGFQGTESQWLESLKGKNGQNGENGVSYEDIRKLYDDLVDNGEYSGSFLDFIKDYIKVYDVGSMNLVANHALLSAVSVSYTYGNTQCSGSGVIYEIDEANEEVYVVTNYHVVYNESTNNIANNIHLYLYGKEIKDSENTISCSYMGGSEAYDVAVLRMSKEGARKVINNHYEEVEIADYNDLSPAEKIIAVGNAEGEGISVVSGSVSVDNRFIAYYISDYVAYYHRTFQYDAQINSGNSGGGLYNSDGKLIGIVCAKHVTKQNFLEDTIDVVEGMCYGVPIVHVDSIYKNIKSKYSGSAVTVKAYDFGMDYVGANSTAYYDNAEHKTKIKMDVAITEVIQNSLAHRAGLQNGDIVKSVKVRKLSGEEVEMEITRDFMLNDILMFANSVGDYVEFKIQRDEGGSEPSLLTKNVTTLLTDNSSLKTLENMALTA